MYRLSRFSTYVIGIVCFILSGTVGNAVAPETRAKPTHKQVRVVRPTFEGQDLRLNTFAIAPSGDLWMCCALTNNSETDSEAGKKAIADLKTKLNADDKSENLSQESDSGMTSPLGRILVYQPEGTFVRSVLLGFEPQAINFADNGIPFVAGWGKIARLTKEGELDLVVPAPNVQSDEERQAYSEKQKKSIVASRLRLQENQIERIRLQIADLEEQNKKLEKDSNGDGRQLERNEKRLRLLQTTLETQEEKIKTLEEETLSQLEDALDNSSSSRASGLAVSPTDVFVSLNSSQGYGYDIYRLSHNLTEAKVVKKKVSGCCGQLDIQCDGTNLVIAENTNFKVATYDRNGKSVSKFGENVRSLKDDDERITAWGSCCNPMNVRCLSNGDVLVAESSIGHVKRYTADGKFLGLIGTAKIGGGCKHVAVAKALDRDWYFMMNTTANNISVLVPLAEAPEETDDERESRLAMQGLGQKLLGSWKFERRTDKDENSPKVKSEDGALEGTDFDSFDYGEHLIGQNKYLQLSGDGKISRIPPPVTSEPSSKKKSGGGFFGFLSNLFVSNAEETSITEEEDKHARWEAIKQEQDIVQFAVFDSDVKSLVASVRFIDDQKAEFKLFYDEVVGEPMAVATYIRIAGCEKENCSTDACEKPANVKAKSTTPEVSEK